MSSPAEVAYWRERAETAEARVAELEEERDELRWGVHREVVAYARLEEEYHRLEVDRDVAEARAEKAEADLVHIRSLLGYPGCTPCIMADEDCEECPVAGAAGAGTT